jgi:predicted aspartyl protease
MKASAILELPFSDFSRDERGLVKLLYANVSVSESRDAGSAVPVRGLLFAVLEVCNTTCREKRCMAQRRGIIAKARLAAAALLLWAGTAGASERLVVPFQISDLEHMIVPIIINNQHHTTGVVDTAATIAMLDGRSAAQSGIALPGPDTPKVNILGLNGAKDYPLVRLGSLRAGTINLGAVDAAYNRDLEIPGAAANVLPSSAFPGDVLEFDFRRMVISAYNGRPDRPQTNYYDRIPYTLDDGLIFIDIHINGRKGRALIDTGSNLTFVNSAFAEHAGLRTNLNKTLLLQGATGRDKSVRVATARKVKLADFFFNDADLLVSDPVMFEMMGLKEEPLMVLGIDFLSAFKVQFDRRRKRMILILPDSVVRGVTVDLMARDTRFNPVD